MVCVNKIIFSIVIDDVWKGMTGNHLKTFVNNRKNIADKEKNKMLELGPFENFICIHMFFKT